MFYIMLEKLVNKDEKQLLREDKTETFCPLIFTTFSVISYKKLTFSIVTDVNIFQYKIKNFFPKQLR